jgi:hypothetical protein
MPARVGAADTKDDPTMGESASFALHPHNGAIAVVDRQVIPESRAHWS